YVQRIEELLEPMTGPGRISAKVSVDMDFAQTEEASERYGPQPAMVRSEQISESGTLGGGGDAVAQGVPGSASNTPDAAADPAPAAAAASGPGSRSAVRNYEIDRTLTHTRQAPGRIRRVTAAVLVDNAAPAATAGNAAPRPGRPPSADALPGTEPGAPQPDGSYGARGVVCAVANAPSARGAMEPPLDGPPIWQRRRARELLRLVLGGLAVLLLIFTVLRPATR